MECFILFVCLLFVGFFKVSLLAWAGLKFMILLV
jgi:hypothetical protein